MNFNATSSGKHFKLPGQLVNDLCFKYLPDFFTVGMTCSLVTRLYDKFLTSYKCKNYY